jgi:hypothetical protein
MEIPDLSWIDAAMPWTDPLVDAALDASLTRCTGTEEERAAGLDRIRWLGNELQQWIASNPSPDAVLGQQLAVLVGRIGFVTLVTGGKVNGSDVSHRSTIVDRLSSVSADLGRFVAELRRWREEGATAGHGP